MSSLTKEMIVTIEHAPVMLAEVLQQLDVQADGTYVDCTLGGGGHASAILGALGPAGRLIGLDRDADALARVESRLGDESRLQLFHENFKNLPLVLSRLGVTQLDGCLIDMGVSTPQLLTPERGFSFQSDGPLDMRMDRSQQTTAADLVNSLAAEELSALFRRYGEEKQARRVASAIVERRAVSPIRTTGELVSVILEVKGQRRSGRIHPATQAFQALRIEVNQELAGLESFLDTMIDLLAVGGRLSVIAFHSLEDRIVKNTFRKAAGSCVCFRPIQVCDCPRVERGRLVTRRPLRPSEEEVEENPKARSARLRTIERVAPQGRTD